MQVDLTAPQLEFVMDTEPRPAIVGGLGCVHPDTRVWTEFGLMRICEIDRPMRVLSWNERSQRFQLSLSGGSFPKGKDYLLRIRSKHGLSRVASHHRIFSSSRKYESLEGMPLHEGALTASPCQLPTILESCLRLSPLDDHCSSGTNADLMGSYADEARLYGQQLLKDQESDLASLPSEAGAHKSCRIFGLSLSSYGDDQEGLSQSHTHHGQSCDQTQTQDYASQSEGIEGAEEDHTSSLPFARTSCTHLKSLLSRAKSSLHHIVVLLHSRAFRLGLLRPYYEPLSNELFVASVEEDKQEYWDLQVLDTNNYICEAGFVHHNSGKSRAGTMRAIKQVISTPGANGAYYMPTYDLLRLRAMPGVEEDLEALGLPFTTNRSEYMITIHGFGFIIFRSYDRPERIVAYEVADSIVDEIDTLPKEKAALVWRKINERNRQSVGRQNTIGVVTTPDQGIHGFVYEKWVKKKQDGYHLIKAPTWSNPFLPDDYIDQIRANYDPILADLYIEGEFVSLSDSKVYHFFNRKDHDTDREIARGDRLYIGLDFNIGGCCATVWVLDGKKPVAVDEFVSHDTYDFVNNLSRYDGHKITVYPDSSGGSNSTNATATDIDIITRAGFGCDAPNKNPFVRDRINSFNALLSKNELAVNCTKCPELAFALESQGYDNKGAPEKFNEHPAIDDWNDGAGYFIHRRFPISRPATKLNAIMPY